MTWINVDDVSAVTHIDLDDDEFILHDITHVQALCEVEIGEQTEPVTNRLKAVVAQITSRIWRAGESTRQNPEGMQQEGLGGWTGTWPAGAGLGLTHAEKKLLRKAVGKLGVGVLTITRGDTIETAGYVDHTGGEPVPWFADEDLP